jgi:hypothetical protein
MRTDLYTKTVLTVIAIALVALVFQNMEFTPKAYAEESELHYNPSPSFNSVSVPLNADGSIDVKITGLEVQDIMDVRIKDIDTYDELNVNIDEFGGSSVSSSSGLKVDIGRISTSDELDVNIDEIGGSYVSSGGPIRVKTE